MLGRLRVRIAASNRSIGCRVAAPAGHVELSLGALALTFDDGPDPIYTPAVLDVLDRLDVTATFFLVGNNAKRHPHIVQRMVESGHAVGSHTRSHPDMWTVSPRVVRREYVEGRKLVEDAVGADVPLVRPPKGWLGLVSAVVFRQGGFVPVLWSESGEDWKPGATCNAILKEIGSPTPGAVILLHDAIERPVEAAARDRSATVEALEPFVRRARAQGLTFTSLDPRWILH